MKTLRHIICGPVLLLLATISTAEVHAQAGLPLDPDKALSQYHLDAWGIDDGLPQGSVYAIDQTPDGYVWLGTQEGLARFDGRTFQSYDKFKSELTNNYISALAVDAQGALWIGTRGGGITRLHEGRFTTYTVVDGLISDEISTLLVDRGGTLWVGTYNAGLALLPGGRIAAQKPLDALPGQHVTALHEDDDGTLWVGTYDQGLSRLRDGTVRTYAPADGLDTNAITAIQRTTDGTLWVGTRDGLLYRFDGQRFHAVNADPVPEDGILTLYEDTSGTLWIGTWRSGLCRWRQAHLDCLSDAQGLAYNRVTTLFQGREGSLWIGTDGGGLNRLRDGKFTTYATSEGLAYDYAYSIYEDAGGALWIGTEAGLNRFKDGRFTTYTTDDGLSNNFVLSVHGTRDGSLWIGTNGGGLNRFKDGRFTTYDALPNDKVWGLFEDSAGVLWIGTEQGLVALRDSTFTTYTTDDGLTSNLITTLTEGKDGSLWVGTYTGGLNRLKDGQVVETLTPENGLEGAFVLATHIDDESTVWLSVREGGLIRYRDGHIATFTPRDGLFSDSILEILEDDQGRLWLASSRGLEVLAKQDLNRYARGDIERLAPTLYDRADGLKTREFVGGLEPAGWKRRDGSLWFPTSGAGIASIDPARTRRNTLPPLVTIEAALANGKGFQTDSLAVIPPGLDKFEFHYTGLSLLAPEKVRFRYKLEGVDEDWVEAGARREAFYTNLAPGRYTFKVMARNNDGVWSEQAATASFYLQPYFHQRPLFYVLCALGLGLLVFTSYRLRVRHLKRRERELVHLVEERTADLRHEKERTEQALRDTEAAHREAEQQKEIAENARAVIEEQAEKLKEMDRVKTRFFSNISHEFRTPLTLNIGPLENALMGAYGPVSDAMRRQLEIMLRNSRLLLRLINQLLDVSKLESGRMALKMHRGNIVELLEGVALSFTAFAEKKNLTLNVQAEPAVVALNYDPRQIEKVFFNLLSNAVKFTPEGGHIAVTLTEETAGAERADGEGVVIRFQDSGAGIPAKELPHVFDRFHQVDGTRSKMQEGTGIGLSLVKELIELHGGTIRVESTLGQGSTFIMTLPKDTRPLNADVTPETNEAVSRGAMVEMAVFDDEEHVLALPSETEGPMELPPGSPVVLVVDDNPEIRAYVAGCMSGAYRVVKAVDGQDALGTIRAVQPDLVISDVMMPNMTGYELCRAIKGDEGLHSTPVILLTSRASLDEKIQGLEAGADDYLTKPFSARELLVRVRNLLNLSQHQKTLQHLNEELQQTNEELREVSEMKSQLLRIAAHDLKNPLNGIREFAKILKEEVPATASSQELLDLIHTSSDQMLDMISKLLDSEVLESGQLVLDKEPVSATAIAEMVVRRNRPQAERKGDQIILQLDPHDDCVVEASRAWLRDAMDNLLSNAIKYAPMHTRIWVRVRRHGDVVRFSVCDEGPGLTEEDKTKLFGKFQRLSAVPTNDESSTGLGLSIVKQIVDLHGGRVWAESEHGQGATFTIELALAKTVRKARLTTTPISG